MDIEIKTESIKLDQLLKFSGLASTGGHAKALIDDGEVRVNGEVVLHRAHKVWPGDEVQVGEESLKVLRA